MEETVKNDKSYFDGMCFEIDGTTEQRVKMFADWSNYLAEVVNPVTEKENTFLKSKYAPLDVVLDVIRPLMAKHNLSIIQIPTANDNMVTVNTIITHSSGAIMVFPGITAKTAAAGIQGVGAAITYLRRYAISAISGVAATGEDDDGNAAAGVVAPKKESAKASKEDVMFTKARADVAKAISAKERELGTNSEKIAECIQGIAHTKLSQVTDVEVLNKIAIAVNALKKEN